MLEQHKNVLLATLASIIMSVLGFYMNFWPFILIGGISTLCFFAHLCLEIFKEFKQENKIN